MSLTDVGNYIQKLFQNHILVGLAAIGAFLYNFFFPTTEYLYGAAAVLGMMILDLLTKLYALKRQHGGWKKSVCARVINSSSFLRGTMDKLVVFGVMVIICGFAYRLTIISSIAVWFTQVVYILMFLRDALSIIENLTDAGIKGLSIFEKIIKHKISDYVDDDSVDGICSSLKDLEPKDTSTAQTATTTEVPVLTSEGTSAQG